MGVRTGFALLLVFGIFLTVSNGAPLHYHHKSGGAPADSLPVSLCLSLVVSLTVLIALAVVLVNCVTCCKENEINFKEFEDHFDDEIDFTPPAEDTPSVQSPAEVYTLAVSPVALPGPPHLQPPSHITEAPTGAQIARHSLSYIQEIGNGWFGQVLLSEIYTDPGGTRVVVKELKANAGSKEQNEFLQLGDPYRVLQHPNILQCLGQCVEAIPFLLVFEYCEMGDLRGYLSHQDWMYRSAEVLQLQRMACEIAAGVTHLHKHNFLHSDLALRNCYLTADLTVKVGDYGIGPYRYKEDYIITEDDLFAPLRWLAPELVCERHGGVITLEQTKASNVWALGVTLWELFENANQPYPHLSDREVLNHVIKEQQVKLFKPQLDLPYSDRWYEVLQFCWLSSDKRATAEEVHRLLIYLRMQGQKDMEEDFEQRWDALKPNPSMRQTTISHSSFPILDQFADDALRQEIDEVLTVTETSKGLSFEYVWEAAKHDHYEGTHGHAGMDTTLNYHSTFFPVSSEDIQAHFPVAANRAADSSSTPSGIPGILSVFDAQKPSNGNEYYIRLEEQGDSGDNVSGRHSMDNRQDFIVLQDVRLDESSTDADFFHQSIDSKDSYLPDSHIWSSLENDSPYHPNIFTEEESKHDDSPSWRQNFMELPERSRNPFHEDMAPQVDSDKNHEISFLGHSSEANHTADLEQVDKEDSARFLNTEHLKDNFMFLNDHSLLKGFSSPQQNFLSPGVAHEPEERFKMTSWDNFDNLGSLSFADSCLKPTLSSTGQKEEEFAQSFLGNETLVPSITVVTEDNSATVQSSSEDLSPPQSAARGLDSGVDSTSDRYEVLASEADQTISVSATIDYLCIDAKAPNSEDELFASDSGVQPIDHNIPENIGHSEDLTSNDLFSELIEDADIELETTLSDHEEAFLDNNPEQLGRSNLLVSGPSLDQISQDSLLEDSISTTLPTMETTAETPDSLDSYDIHRIEEKQDDVTTQAAPSKLQPPYKISDSGYETENMESPEWNSQPGVKDPVQNGIIGESEAELEAPVQSLTPPEIVISDAERLDDASSDEPPEQPENVIPPQPIMSSHYRDSAYFSDNESEPDKKSEEIVAGGSVEATWLSSTDRHISDEVQADEENASTNADVSENSSDLTLEVEVSSDSQLDNLVNLERDIPVSNEEEPIQSIDDLNSPAENAEFSNNLTTTERSEYEPTADDLSPVSDNTGHSSLTRLHASEGNKIKEPDVEGRYLGRLDGHEDGMEADEEDENSEDSDDDMRAYRLHSSSSDSEDETTHPVPLIISDDTSAKNLRSLLKPTSLNINAASPPGLATTGNADNSRRAVSFFDDVTVYLFDQETPTKELGDHSGSSNSHVPEFGGSGPTASYLNRFTNSESSTDEEGGGFEWDDDFSSPGPKALSPSAATSLAREPHWTTTSSYSRFSISPASIASFSLTHLTDSDIEQGGNGEDGEKD
ncbi:serine/threonine-protein kinase LMTK2 isoform X1 [Boleophthalmus pectinirostris]|uniref:serine/threonine-protein kinase LMTK2 isoform X1 n=1 Tax=Boleophthalmus pectinirostris TaxID=150288 RepID=UPI002430113A|nr:serine/threonine-protein kinase LMTK2 isoform X1 [Boleophthalmus pectinirostris]